MIFSVQRFLEDYFSNRGWNDPDYYAVKFANAYWSEGSPEVRLRRIARIRTIFFAANRSLDRRKLERDLFAALERRFKKKLEAVEPHLRAVVAALPAQRKLLAARAARVTIDVLLDQFRKCVEALLIDAFWVSRVAKELRNRPEAIAQALLAAFAEGVLRGRGVVVRELQSGVGFIDVALIRGAIVHLIEIKVENSRFRGIEQIDNYMHTQGRREGWLVVFDASPPGKNLSIPPVVNTPAGRVRVVRIDINPPVPSRRRTA